MAADTPAVDYSLFTSLRYDPALQAPDWNADSPLSLESYHLDRLRSAATTFDWPQASKAVEGPEGARRFHVLCVQRASEHPNGGPKKPVLVGLSGRNKIFSLTSMQLRVTLSKSGQLDAETFDPILWPHDLLSLAKFNPTMDSVPYPDTLYSVTIDTEPTQSSEYTRNKTTRRTHYDAARERAGIKSRAERREVILYNERGEIMEGSVTNVSFWRNNRWTTPSLSAGGLPGTVRRWLLAQGDIVEGQLRTDDLRDGEFVLLTNSWHFALLGRIAMDTA